MNTLVFQNKGSLDPRSIATFGVSSKENPGAIGFFGTGLKYAIAVFLRLGGEVVIYSDGKKFSFATKSTRIRVHDFDVVTMNGKELGFTTELGKTWQAWQAFRELWCNAKDEGGTVFEDSGLGKSPRGAKGETMVVVKGSAVMDAWHTRSEVILDSEPTEMLEGLHIHPGISKFVFYRGIRVQELQSPSIHTYNIQRRIELTEDRTAKYSWEVFSTIARGLASSNVEGLLGSALTADRDRMEHALDFDGHPPSTRFSEMTRKLSRAFDPRLNHSALKCLRSLGLDIDHSQDSVKLNSVEEKQLQKALEFAEFLGYSVGTYPITVIEFLGEEVTGRADMNSQRIYLSRKAFQIGTKHVAGTLIEEYLHLKHRLHDESRSLQNFLLDAVVSLGERLKGEPL